MFTDYSYGRAEVILKSMHFNKVGIVWESGDSFWFLFNRFIYISGNFKKIFYFYLCTLPITALLLKRKLDKKIIHLSLIIVSFYLCITFAINSVAPYHSIMPFQGRFLMCTYPFLILYSMFFLQQFLNFYSEYKIFSFLKKTFNLNKMMVVMFAVLIIVAFRSRANLKNHSFFKLTSRSEELNLAYLNGVPFISKNDSSVSHVSGSISYTVGHEIFTSVQFMPTANISWVVSRDPHSLSYSLLFPF